MAARRKKPKRRSADKRNKTRKRRLTSSRQAKSSRPKQPKRPRARRAKAMARRRRPRPVAPVTPRPESIFQRRRVVICYQDGFDEERERRKLAERYGRSVLRPVFALSRSRDAVQRLQARARERDPRYSWPNFLNYYFLYLRPSVRPDAAARELRGWSTIGSTYVDAPTKSASPGPTVDMCEQSSGHIEGQQKGVNAKFAWDFEGGKGEGQFLVDVELGWVKEHQRLPTSKIKLLAGLSLDGEKRHGTSVLGIVCGKHSPLVGCEGIAPEVDSVGLVSCEPNPNAQAPELRIRPDDQQTALRENIHDAIVIGTNALVQKHDSSPGSGCGVLLLERHTDKGLPVETYELIFGLIKTATSLGITVVEPAGNTRNGKDLGLHPDAQILTQDSGAIMVGSAKKEVIRRPPAPDHHERFHSSNFGSRVNCYAWGEGVVTPAWISGPPEILNACDKEFGSTSAAAAIIAGVALVVQGIVARAGAAPLSVAALRDFLSDPALGTPCAPGDNIGVMPDLEKILRALRVPLTRRS